MMMLTRSISNSAIQGEIGSVQWSMKGEIGSGTSMTCLLVNGHLLSTLKGGYQ